MGIVSIRLQRVEPRIQDYGTTDTPKDGQKMT